MKFELIKLILLVLLLTFNGMILFRAIANKLLVANDKLDDNQLFAQGLFISLIINGIVGQYLAIFHLFKPVVFIIIFIINIIFFWKETISIIKYIYTIPLLIIRLIKSDILCFMAACLFISLAIIMSFDTQIPSFNVDVWVHHKPIADSIVNNSGFIYPIISHLFYGNMPSFIEVIFAEGLILTNNFQIAGVIHYFILIYFLIMLLSFVKKPKALAFILLSLILIDPIFDSAVSAMTDTARACFDVAAIIFLVSYFNNKSNYYLFFSALLCGAGLASKYLGLLTLFLAGLIFLGDFHLDKIFLKKIGVYLIGILMVSGFWYGKNLICYQNPIYPYFFGHPGLSDKWMADLKEDQGKSFDLEYRNYSRDILSLDGWRDFFRATYRMFFDPKIFAVIFSTTLFSVFLIKDKLKYLAPLSMVYFALWYFLVFHHARYGMTGYLLSLAAFFFSAVFLVEKMIDGAVWQKLKKISNSFKGFKIISIESIFMILVTIFCIKILNITDKVHYFYTIKKELIKVYVGDSSFDEYMAKLFPYYKLYSFIAKNKLTNVFNPLDSASTFYIKNIIPGKSPDDSFIPWYKVCASTDELDSFLRENKIKYFVVLESLSPLALERFGKKHTDMAFNCFQVLAAKSDLIYSDDKGNKLYAIRKD